MLLQTNSYIVPKDRRSEHARLLRKFRSTMMRLGADDFEVYEQVGANWAAGEVTGRFVQIMRFRDRKHQQMVQAGEKQDAVAQQLIQEFCALINFPYQQQQGLFAVGFYTSALPVAPPTRNAPRAGPAPRKTAAQAGAAADASETASGGASAGAEEASLASETLALPDAATSREREGSSLLDFAGLAPAAQEPEPLRLTSDADEVIESDIAPPEESSHSALQPPVEDSANGEHAGSFSDAPEAMLGLAPPGPEDDDLISEADREAVLGELVGDDDADVEGRRQKAEG